MKNLAGTSGSTTRRRFLQQMAAAMALPLAAGRSTAAAPGRGKGNLVFVVGTHHYHPEQSMPPLAKELERLGFHTQLILPPGDPEENHNGAGLPGLEALDHADAAVFFLRFLTLNDEQLGHLERYLKSGKPLVGLRTSTHAFRYPASHRRAAWNDDFGRNVLGTHWLTHMRSVTECRRLEQAKNHPILTGIDEKPFQSPGQLYITDLQPGCVPLVVGSGEMPREQILSHRFGTRIVARTETDILAWTWQNHYGARVFATTLGHPRDFAVPQIMRIVVNGIHWAAGAEVPSASTEVKTFDLPLNP
ncbi:MAG: ThuA domain-containing protein [Verrucomicrobiia bacterium]